MIDTLLTGLLSVQGVLFSVGAFWAITEIDTLVNSRVENLRYMAASLGLVALSAINFYVVLQ